MYRSLPAVIVLSLVLASPAVACGSMGSTGYGLLLLGALLAPVFGFLLVLFAIVKLLSALFGGSRSRRTSPYGAPTASLRFRCRQCRPGQVRRYRTERGWECEHALGARSEPARPEPAVTVQPVRVEAGARCPVCNSGVDGRLLACGRCAVPHHEDCFAYNGGCAIFGCVA